LTLANREFRRASRRAGPVGHAHGRLSPLECSATPLQALAKEIARPKGLSMQNGDLLTLVVACHQQLALRMNKQAWREMAANLED
jgi:hypothetical protein